MPPFVVEHRVPWPDVDLARMVYFPRFFSYFEMAELEWIRSQGFSYESFLSELDIWMPRKSVECDYHAPARLGDLLSIEMRLRRMGRSSFTFGYDAYRLPDRTHLADGRISIVTVSRERFRPVSIPGELRNRLSELGGADATPETSARARKK